MARDVQMFMSTHYIGVPQDATFTHGETWKKVFGPVFIYLNSVSDKSNVYSLWNDAKQQVYIFFFFLNFMKPLIISIINSDYMSLSDARRS